jgi:AbrB family looped-hinge helix DNA binding protein
MTTVTVSPKYQIVIPAQTRRDFVITPGEKLQVISFRDRIELLPVRKMKTMRGFLKNMDTSFQRERDRK